MNLLPSSVILAAGNSGRMGCDKALLPFGHGETFTGHLLKNYRIYGCRPVILVVNEKFDPVPVHMESMVTVVNHHLVKGRSWSILLGLKQVPSGNSCFIQNVDNPFIEAGLLDILIESVTPDGYAVPVYQGHGGHPVLLGSKLAESMCREQELPDFRSVLDHFIRIEVPYPDASILWNINTPGDYKEFIFGNRH